MRIKVVSADRSNIAVGDGWQSYLLQLATPHALFPGLGGRELRRRFHLSFLCSFPGALYPREGPGRRAAGTATSHMRTVRERGLDSEREPVCIYHGDLARSHAIIEQTKKKQAHLLPIGQ